MICENNSNGNCENWGIHGGILCADCGEVTPKLPIVFTLKVKMKNPLIADSGDFSKCLNNALINLTLEEKNEIIRNIEALAIERYSSDIVARLMENINSHQNIDRYLYYNIHMARVVGVCEEVPRHTNSILIEADVFFEFENYIENELEKVYCPYCGAEMKKPYGVDFYFLCTNSRCCATSPKTNSNGEIAEQVTHLNHLIKLGKILANE